MEPDFILHSSLSPKDKETFLNFYNKSLYYEDIRGHMVKVPEYIFSDILQKWDLLPDTLKEKATLQAIAKYQPQRGYVDGSFEPKEFGMQQINYNKDYFPSKKEYERICDELHALPDDKKSVYDYLHAHSMFNLNYVPNKIRLLDDYVSDKLNISFSEKMLWLKDRNLKYEDLVGFGDKQRNFSHNNYLKSVDSLMAIIANDADGATRFRKIYQHNNLPNAVQYEDLCEYNSYGWNDDDDFDYDDDDYDYDEDDYNYNDEEDYDYKEESPAEKDITNISEDTILFEDKKHKFDTQIPSDSNEPPFMHLYNQNEKEIFQTSYALCRVFGSQADTFIKRFLEVEDKHHEKNNPNYPLEPGNKAGKENLSSNDSLKDDLEFFAQQEFMAKKRINSAKSKRCSIDLVQKEEDFKDQKKLEVEKNNDNYVYTKRELCSQEAQEKLLSLLSVLPRDFNEEKYKSFEKFMWKHFFYKELSGKVCTRPIEELEKIINAWPQLNDAQEKMKYSEILNLAKVNGYLNSRAEEFETEAKLRKLPKMLFDTAQSAYLRGMDTPRTIKGNDSMKAEDYTLRLMDIADPSIMFVGEGFSCQTITKAGVYPALSSVQDPFSRAMVVEKNDKIVGLAWVWTTEEEKYGQRYKSMCIDNLELADYVCDEESLSRIMSGLAQLSIKIADEQNFRRVTLGAHATHYMPENYFEKTNTLNLPETYTEQTPLPHIKEKINYGDSAQQVLVYENPLAAPLGKGVDVFVAHRDAYTITKDEEKGALAAGDKAYPWKAEFREKNKDSQFILLKDQQNKVLGYALYSDKEHHIYDVAIDPDYKAYSKTMLFELLKHMKENSDKPWKAECRESTSLALLEKLASKGSIHLERKNNTFLGIQGERLHEVLITFDTPNQTTERTSLSKESGGR